MKTNLTLVWLCSLCMFFLNDTFAQRGTNYDGVQNQNGILSFDSQNTFESILQDLRVQSDVYFSQNPNAKIPCGVDDPILEAFENNLRFNSIRKKEILEECTLLTNGASPESLPKPMVLDVFLSALLNEKGQLKIDSDIHYLYSETITYTVVGGSLNTLRQLESGANPFTFSDVLVSNTSTNCSAEFSVNPSANSNTVNFTFQGQIGSGIGSFLWEFGDGTTASTQNTSHTYQNQGQFEVCLNIETNEGETPCVDRVCKTISVGNSNCIAAFIYNETGAPGQICFQDLSDVLGDIATWEWSFGDGSPVSTEQNPCHTYACDKTYYANLKITTTDGCISSMLIPVFVSSNNCCSTNANDNGYAFYNNEQSRIAFGQGQLNYIFLRLVVAKMINYKLNNNGNWRRERADLKIVISGDVFVKGASGCKCETPYPVDYTEIKYNKKSLSSVSWVNEPFKARQTQEWNAQFYVDNTLIHQQDIPVGCD